MNAMGMKNYSLEHMVDVVWKLQEKIKILENERNGIFYVVDGDKPMLMRLIERLNRIEERIQSLEADRKRYQD